MHEFHKKNGSVTVTHYLKAVTNLYLQYWLTDSGKHCTGSLNIMLFLKPRVERHILLKIDNETVRIL
jgi:hypothetical protein